MVTGGVDVTFSVVTGTSVGGGVNVGAGITESKRQ